MSKTDWPLCLNTSTIRPASLEDKIAIAAETGYAAVELWSDDLTRFEKQGGSLSEVRTRISDAGLKVPSVIALFDWMQTEGAHKDPAFAEVRRRMDQAASIGAPYIVASPVPDAANVDIGRAAAAYHELLELGDEIGVTPAMEFLGFFRNVFQLEQAVAISQQGGHPKACIVLDPFHLHRGGSGFGGIKLLKDVKISICHFNDVPVTPPQFELTDSDRVYPGDGMLPLAELLRDLSSIGYTGFLSVELFNEGYWQQDPRAVASTACEKTKAIVYASAR